MNKRQWKSLITDIREGRCILVLGPDASLHSEDGPTLEKKLFEALRKTVPSFRRAELTDLNQVMQHYLSDGTVEGRRNLEEDVIDFYQGHQTLSSPLHQHLAQLPFSLVVTTTHDHLLETAWKQSGKTPEVDYYHLRRPKQDRLAQLTRSENTPFLYHLYGHPSDAESLILSENDLLDLLVKAIQKSPSISDYILGCFADKNASFLFVGFGFHQWYLRILLHLLNIPRTSHGSGLKI